jgi:competence protein ComEA
MARSLLRIVAFVTIIATQSLPAFAQAASRAATKPAAAATAIVNLNTATAADFEALPGIGAKMAARIVDYRQKNGPFKKIEDLMNVPGIGEKNFLKLKPQLTVASAKADASARQN